MTRNTRAGAEDAGGAVRHTIDATADEVFDAWAKPALIEAWWGPEGITTRVRELDFIEGGRFVFEMTGPDGDSCLMTGVYKRIARPSLIAMEIADHCNLSLPDGIAPQLEPSSLTVRFEPAGDRTTVIVRHTALRAGYAQLAAHGWGSTLRRLGALRGPR